MSDDNWGLASLFNEDPDDEDNTNPDKNLSGVLKDINDLSHQQRLELARILYDMLKQEMRVERDRFGRIG